jgi:phospho-N-acetylmuramoyl-pentapeptide-transferase
MLYHIFEYLDKVMDIPGTGVFKYVSFRSSLALLSALALSTLSGKHIITWLQRRQIGETVRDLNLEGQYSKHGTPTMGGIIIILAILLPVTLLARLDNVYIGLMLLTTVWLGIIGFTDDYIKVVLKDKAGLQGRVKILGQAGLGLIIGLTLYFSPQVVIRENIESQSNVSIESVEHKSTKTTIPFLKNNNFDYAVFVSWAGEHSQTAAWIVFVLVVILVVTAVSNGANLSDGLDGLAAGSSAIIAVALGILAYTSSHFQFASFLNIMFIPGAEELVIFAAAFIGATLGFLWFNSFPAQVFMGDTGSLTLGGIIAVFALIIRKELLLPLLCGIFFIESLSVILQVVYFKYTRKRFGVGKRIFKMTPLHHHFQKAGNVGIDALIQRPILIVPESKIVIRFWLVGIILAVITLITLKIR